MRNEWWKRWFIAPLLAIALVVAGCSADEPTSTEQENEAVVEPFMTMEDATGETVVLEREPETIATLLPSNTEIVYALGLGDRVVGVSEFDTYPEEVEDVDVVSGMTLNVESLIEKAPDLVLAHEMQMDAAEGLNQLREAGIPVFVVKNASNFDETYETIAQIGELTNRTEEAEQIVATMQQRVDAVFEKTKAIETPRRVFIETSDVPDIYTAGANTFPDEMLSFLHAENVVTEDDWFAIDPEVIIERNPDVYIIMYDYVPDIVERVKARDGFSTIQAVRDDRVVQLDEDLMSRQGPRLVDGLEQLAEAIYPEWME